MAEVRLEQLGTRVVLSDPRDPFPGDGFVDFHVELGDEGLLAETTVRTHESLGVSLSGFLRRIADDWQGFQGRREWEAIEQGLHLTAFNDNFGHVVMRFELRESHLREAWTASVELVLEPGEQMSNFAADVAEFLHIG